ncbi:unnamed protein product [Microthlaspi erraticum]|uniref:Tf2-1-like SH3-like domain-containing protein n=1 Tax=Microthlaspi erraticum TaxID=1685480 RepID=A0A6D2IF03_9BRAS|nr:unnamed protein product [Microthlaspi erraticum]
MSPYEALYGRPCRILLCWTEIGERRVFGPPIVDHTMDRLMEIRANMKKAQDRQKKYADQRRREVTFERGDMVYLKVAAQKGKDRFGKIGKLAVRYIGPYKIIGKVADPNAIEPERIEDLRQDLTYPEGPIKIGLRRVRELKNRRIPQIQVFWGRQNRMVITWEDEERFRANYRSFSWKKQHKWKKAGHHIHREFGTNSLKWGRM